MQYQTKGNQFLIFEVLLLGALSATALHLLYVYSSLCGVWWWRGRIRWAQLGPFLGTWGGGGAAHVRMRTLSDFRTRRVIHQRTYLGHIDPYGKFTPITVIYDKVNSQMWVRCANVGHGIEAMIIDFNIVHRRSIVSKRVLFFNVFYFLFRYKCECFIPFYSNITQRNCTATAEPHLQYRRGASAATATATATATAAANQSNFAGSNPFFRTMVSPSTPF